ncbi:MAG: alpha/beta hydrolase [Pseudomonadota bacterium]
MTLIKTTTAAAIAALSFAASGQAIEPVRVTFESQGETLVGNLYLPDGASSTQRLPAVVVTGAWTTVKEQMPATYAAELAERGYAALAFDFRGWGESEGAPRQLESPVRKTEDIIAAAAYLASRSDIDAARVGGLGICASAGYMVAAASMSEDIASVGLVAPWLHDAEIVDAVYGGAENVAGLIETGRAAEAVFAETGEPVMIEAASATNEASLMYQAAYYVDPERGAIADYVNAFNVASWEGWLSFDALEIADHLTDPVAIIHSEAAAIPQGAHRFYERTEAPKRALWLDGVSQFNFYDQPEAVQRSSDAVAAHFAETLDQGRG